MDRYELARLSAASARIDKEQYILDACRGKSVLDLGCVRHRACFAKDDPHWLHGGIAKVARRCLGVDYLRDEVAALKALGFDVVWGDVTRPLDVRERFEVIVAGDLIEHLTNFEGFFANCERLLEPQGRLILTTPNPFYAEGFHYAAIKGRVLVNPEHTCWIDPQTMLQLVTRFGFVVQEIHFMRGGWRLKNLICDGPSDPYDILTDRWRLDSPRHRAVRRILGALFSLFYAPYRWLCAGRSPAVTCSDYLVCLGKPPAAA